MEFVTSGVRAFPLPAGASITLRQGSPGATGVAALASSDGATGFTQAALTNATPVTVGPFAADAVINVMAIGTVSVDSVGGSAGSSTYAGLSDAGTVDLGAVNAPLAGELGGKADLLSAVVLGAGATAITHSSHANRPVSVNQAGATTGTFAAAGTSGAIAGDGVEILNVGAGTFTASGAITAASGFKLTALPGETFTALYNAATDAWYSTTVSTAGGSVPTIDGLASSGYGQWTAVATGASAGAANGSVNTPSTLLDTCAVGSGAAVSDPAGYIPRLRYTAAASAINRVAGVSWSSVGCPLNTGQGGVFNGGFPIVIEGCASDATAAASFFMGLTGISAGPNFTATEPSAFTTDILGVGWDSTGANSSNLGIIHNDNAGTPVYTDLGASFAKAQGQLWRILIDKDATGANLTIAVTKVNPAGADTVVGPTTISTDIPRTTIAVMPCIARSSMASVAQVSIDIHGVWKGKL